MAILTATQTNTCLRSINAVCVDVIDHGVVETPWGHLPRISFVFETEPLQGCPQYLTRTFNNYPYPNSGLTQEIRNWLGFDISTEDDDWNPEGGVGEPAQLDTTETVGANGNHYWKINAVHPAGTEQIQASGGYIRKEKQNL